MTPWLMLTVLVGAVNLAALVLVRGRWGRIVLLLLPVSMLGTAAGEALGGATGLEVVRIGDFHLVSACVGAQVTMLAVLLVANALPTTDEPGEG